MDDVISPRSHIATDIVPAFGMIDTKDRVRGRSDTATVEMSLFRHDLMSFFLTQKKNCSGGRPAVKSAALGPKSVGFDSDRGELTGKLRNVTRKARHTTRQYFDCVPEAVVTTRAASCVPGPAPAHARRADETPHKVILFALAVMGSAKASFNPAAVVAAPTPLVAAPAPVVAPVARVVAAAAPYVAAPAPFVTATSSQYYARNYNGVVAAAAPLLAPAPAPLVAAAPYVAAPAAPVLPAYGRLSAPLYASAPAQLLAFK
ncbi:hypothetical protein EVAR_28323_1 [Eumeta japonica]|uniref:Cuticle protein 16.5 n=1 Tax=Eumeta variegata TaxID=151549 RepID=A0A4C1VAY8_EUMVA|nr:hypothetical protein EVAR_28323_1 [Eumeta japonica]